MADDKKVVALPRPKLPPPVRVMSGGKTVVIVSGKLNFTAGGDSKLDIKRVE